MLPEGPSSVREADSAESQGVGVSSKSAQSVGTVSPHARPWMQSTTLSELAPGQAGTKSSPS